MLSTPKANVLVVVIGRNEGKRLRRCLHALLGQCGVVVYVDSGSSDGSAPFARSVGVEVVELDVSAPFTAARARNAGVRRALELQPQVKYVQFIDGDCEIAPGWLERARMTLDEQPDLAVVAGRLRERSPERSIYNRLCDMEWDGPVGHVRHCGGVAMTRVEALQSVAGFDERIVAGEEPELCVRLRQRGWKITRIDAEMGLHSAAMTRFTQWWKRAVRAGHAYAEGVALHGAAPERHNIRQLRSALFWGLVVPAGLIVAALAGWTWTAWAWVAVALLISGYALLGVRVYRRRRRRGNLPGDAALYAAFCVLAKFPQVFGALRYWRNCLLKRQSALIEYKHTPLPEAAVEEA